MAPELPIRALTLDVGGTLIEPWPSVGHIYAIAGVRHGFTGLNPVLLSERFVASWKAQSAFDYSRESWMGIVEECFRGLIPETKLGVVFESAYALFTTAGAWRIHDDVRPFLERLKGFPLKVGIVSNFDERLEPLLCDLGLSRAFDVILASKAIGVHKPAPGVFHECCRRLGVQPSECLHVGDSFREDWLGATGAGMRAVLVDRTGLGCQKKEGVWADSLDQILDKLMMGELGIVNK